MFTSILQICWRNWNSAIYLIPLTYCTKASGVNIRVFDFWVFRFSIFRASLPEFIAAMNREARVAEVVKEQWRLDTNE